MTGGDGNRSTLGESGFIEILERFAPRAQQRREQGGEIDILIATDCLSEGQNLQDCDLVVNYDIHWNPVRLMQRFGRIDRIGSRNREVAMVNFWPTANLDRYLHLKNRVEARMALADAAATGRDDPLTDEQPAQAELRFRDDQLKRLREEILDIEDTGDGVSLSDFTLDDFVADLLNYLQQNRAALEAAPLGIRAVVDGEPRAEQSAPSGPIRPGTIFCLRQKNVPGERSPNPLQSYFLVYVRDDGTVRYTFRHAKQVLSLFRTLASGRQEALLSLVDAFDRETGNGQNMKKYERLLAAALRSIAGVFRKAGLRQLAQGREAALTKASEQPNQAGGFELVTWLVIVE